MKKEYGALVEWYRHGKNEVLVEKPLPLPVCPPQIPYRLDTYSYTRTEKWKRSLWRYKIRLRVPNSFPYRYQICFSLYGQDRVLRNVTAT